MTQRHDCVIKKYVSDSIILAPLVDYTGWELKYLVKINTGNADEDAILSIIPDFYTENEKVKIIIPFYPDTLKEVKDGTYYHSCKVISTDKLTVIDLFEGKLTIKESYIKYPVGILNE